MIKYKLECEECKNSFDSWFGSSKEYDKLKKLNRINCNRCDSREVKKSLMSPQILNNKDFLRKNKNLNEKKLQYFKGKVKEYQKFIKNNFEYVGENFTYEARSIHYDSKKKRSKGIYGNASKKEIKSLKDEGIETQIIPWFNDKEN